MRNTIYEYFIFFNIYQFFFVIHMILKIKFDTFLNIKYKLKCMILLWEMLTVALPPTVPWYNNKSFEYFSTNYLFISHPAFNLEILSFYCC